MKNDKKKAFLKKAVGKKVSEKEESKKHEASESAAEEKAEGTGGSYGKGGTGFGPVESVGKTRMGQGGASIGAAKKGLRGAGGPGPDAEDVAEGEGEEPMKGGAKSTLKKWAKMKKKIAKKLGK